MKRRRYIPAFLCHYSGKLSAAYLLQYIFQPLYRIKDIMSDELILVDEHDNTLGYDEKLRVHQLGLLHRAFSVFLFNDAGELLIQQRALSKYLPADCGPTAAAVIPAVVNRWNRRHSAVCRKSWGSPVLCCLPAISFIVRMSRRH